MRILAINVRNEVLTLLHQGGISFDVKTISQSQDLEAWLFGDQYQACIVDLDRSGLNISMAYSLRLRNIPTPLLGITNGSPEESWSDWRALFLEKGGDDLLQYPVHGRELLASLNAITRRFNFTLKSEVEFRHGDAHLQVNLVTQEIILNGRNPPLIGKEFDLVILLATTPSRLYSKDEIVTKLFDDRHRGLRGNNVAVTVNRIRNKFGAINQDARKLIENIKRKGYRLHSQRMN